MSKAKLEILDAMYSGDGIELPLHGMEFRDGYREKQDWPIFGEGEEDYGIVELSVLFANGDYAGSGSVGVANRKALKNECERLFEWGLICEVSLGYGYVCLHACPALFLGKPFPVDVEGVSWEDIEEERDRLIEILEGLENYPLIDDGDTLYEAEEERRDEAWNDWAQDDTRREIAKILDIDDDLITLAHWDDFEEDEKRCEAFGLWIDEQGGAWIKTEELAKLFAADPYPLLEGRASLRTVGIQSGDDFLDSWEMVAECEEDTDRAWILHRTEGIARCVNVENFRAPETSGQTRLFRGV